MLSRLSQPLRACVPAFSTLAGLFYPPECAGCDAALKPGEYLCAACADGAPRVEAPFCAMCSLPLRSVSAAGVMRVSSCANCEGRAFAFGCAVSGRRHEGLVRELVRQFKYQGKHHLRRPLAGWLAEALDDPRIARQRVDALVPVPLHPRKRRERGYNQAEECARLLGREAGLPVWAVLRRTRYTDTQTHLTRDERMENLRGAFALAGGFAGGRLRRAIGGAHLLVVDDVFTSGATVDACARVLRQAGAASVRVLTVARR